MLGNCRDSSVGIATRYGLGDPEIESQRGRDFTPWGPIQPHTVVIGCLSRG